MKKNIMFLGLMIASISMFAQPKADPRERSTKHANRMKSALALTDVQYNKIKTIDEEHITKQSAVLKDSTLSKESRHRQLRALSLQKASAIENVLTAEQKDKWAAARAEQTKRRQSHVKKSRGEHALHMQKNLSLSDEQTSKMKAIDKEFVSKLKELRNDSTLAREDSREKSKLLREEYRLKTKAILTEEQFQKWQAQKSGHKQKKS